MMPKLPLSVTIIAYNEVDRIEAAIRSCGFASEVLVVDSGSTDGTVELARSLGAKVVVRRWDGFVRQKQGAVHAASYDWVLSIDADERVTPALSQEIVAKFAEDTRDNAYSVPRQTWWQGLPLRGGNGFPDRRVRLFDRRKAHWGGEEPHDIVIAQGPVGRLQGVLEHHSYRSLSDHLLRVAKYAELQANGLVERNVRVYWWDWSIRPLVHVAKAIVWKGGWRDGPRGFAVAFVGGAHVALKWGLAAIRCSPDVRPRA